MLAIVSFAFVSGAQERKLPPTLSPPSASTQAATGIQFTDVTKAAGLSGFQHTSGTRNDYIIEASGSGAAWFDYDNDGWQDIYLVNGGTMDVLRGKEKAPRAALFRNNRDGTFTDVTEKAGVANERFGQGVCAGDFDNDGWADFYVTNYGKNRLYRNNRDGTFTDLGEKSGTALGGWSTGCAFGDFDNDGLLDLFVAGYIELDLNNLPPPGSGDLKNETKGQEGDLQSTTRNPQSKGMGASYKAGQVCLYRNEQVMCGPRGLRGAPDHLFRNNGDGTFTEVSEKAGVADKAGYYGFGVAWFDMDDDGWLDLIVANDSTPNGVYRNKGNGTFEDVSYMSGAALDLHGREQAHMGVTIGDYDGDGHADIHITNFADDVNVLYRNDGKGNFTDETYAAGLGEVTIPFLGWGTNFFDYDNDGLLDLFVANGHVYPLADKADWNSSYRQRSLLFRNVKNRFYEIGSGAGAALNVPRASRGSAIADFDNDGDQDILLNNIGESPTLLRNDGGNQQNHWLTIRLIGDPKQKCPRDAIGSIVFATAGGRKLRAETASGRSYLSQNDLRVHLGYGAESKSAKINVRWAGGKTEYFEINNLGQFVVLEQGKGISSK